MNNTQLNIEQYTIKDLYDVFDMNTSYSYTRDYVTKKWLNPAFRNREYKGKPIESTKFKGPQDLEYEKTFFPFLILTKKRYVGNKYEEDVNKYKQDYNGIVLKRRDNAPIVKKICGGIINCLINERNPEGAKKYTIE